MWEESPDEQLLQHLSCVVFDLETTGLGSSARIVEIGLVRLEAWKPVYELQTLLQPGIPIPRSASKVHHITDSMVLSAPDFNEVAPQIAHMIQDAVLVGHNIFSFDLRFLMKQLREAFGAGPNNMAVDTLRLARKLMPGPSHKLGELSAKLNIPIVAHHAMSDVYATAELWMHLARLLMDRGGKQLLDVGRFKALRKLDGLGLPRYQEPPASAVPLLPRPEL